MQAFKDHFALKIENYKDDPLVKHGGIKAMIANFLKHNKDAYKSFKKHVEQKNGSKEETNGVVGKKRRRASSVADSEASVSEKKTKKRPRTSSVVSASSAGTAAGKKKT